jgi:hypothetical protein
VASEKMDKDHTSARRLRFHCCNFSFGINQGGLSLVECPSDSFLPSWVEKFSFSSKFEYLSCKGLHKPKSESFKWPFLSSIRLSGFMSLHGEHSLSKEKGKLNSTLIL